MSTSNTDNSVFLVDFPCELTSKDQNIILISRKIVNLKYIHSFSYDVESTLNLWVDFEFYISWSYDNKSFNIWRNLIDFSGLEFPGDRDVWLKVAISRKNLKGNLLPIKINDFNFKLTLNPKLIPNTEHTFEGFGDYNQLNANDYIDKSSDLRYDIYAVSGYFEVYKEMSNLVHDFVGIEIDYIKTVPDDNSADYFFKEYSINREFEVKKFKIVVPGNEFHGQFPQYGPLAADFSDMPWETHIVKERFEECFGYNARPIRGDFLFIPLTNKLYLIDGVVLDRSFLESTGTFYRVSLIKYENKSNTINSKETIDNLDLLTTSMSDFDDQIIDEFKDIKKPNEHDVIIKNNNWVWENLNSNVDVITKNLEKNYTIISKNYYDFSKVGEFEEAIIWNNLPQIQDELAINFWFKKQNINEIYPLVSMMSDEEDCKNYNLNKGDGLFIKIMNGSVTLDDYIGESNEPYKLDFNFNNEEWYGVNVNISNTFNEIGIWVWGFNSERNSRLTLLSNKRFPLCRKIQVNENDLPKWRALGGNYQLTNMKVMKKTISEENQSLFLTQYVVNDSKNIYFVDTARPFYDEPTQIADKSQIQRLRNNFK